MPNTTSKPYAKQHISTTASSKYVNTPSEDKTSPKKRMRLRLEDYVEDYDKQLVTNAHTEREIVRLTDNNQWQKAHDLYLATTTEEEPEDLPTFISGFGG